MNGKSRNALASLNKTNLSSVLENQQAVAQGKNSKLKVFQGCRDSIGLNCNRRLIFGPVKFLKDNDVPKNMHGIPILIHGPCSFGPDSKSDWASGFSHVIIIFL